MKPMNGNPTRYIGQYVLTLYCDHLHSSDDKTRLDQFFGRTFSTCQRQAQRKGWRVHLETKTATCPACARDSKARATKAGNARVKDQRQPHFKIEVKRRRPL